MARQFKIGDKPRWTRLKKIIYLNHIYNKRVKRPENSDVPPAP